ncbi:MAG: hypothetical protein JSW07_10125 [bacterium]|nr:MAG: hypothetical protein JSW07_10125 [bacterium]
MQLKPGMNLIIEEIDGKISLEPISEKPELIDKNGILVVQPKITGDIDNVMQRDRKERIDKLIGDFAIK